MNVRKLTTIDERVWASMSNNLAFGGRNSMANIRKSVEESTRFNDDWGCFTDDGKMMAHVQNERRLTMFDGHKVFPTQLENTIGKHQGVVSCAVVGVQDPSKNQGQMPVGIIKIKDGLDAEQVIQEVTETIQKEVEVRSWLSDLITVEDMPHTGMGKIDYKKLAEDYEKENQTAKAG
jgi:acyl-coenzyme A synthetase/AMP-(fatty) acid ligase